MERIWATGFQSDHQTFQPYETWADLGDGRGQQKVQIDSLAKLRKVEHLTEKAWRDGFPGAQPIVARIFSQDEGNGGRFRNVFGEAPKVAGTFKTRNRDGSKRVEMRNVTVEVRDPRDLEDAIAQKLKSLGVDVPDEPLYAPDHLFQD